MTATSGYPTPSGAGANVDLIAAEMYREGGLELLDKYTKLHFANTQKAIRLANRELAGESYGQPTQLGPMLSRLSDNPNESDN